MITCVLARRPCLHRCNCSIAALNAVRKPRGCMDQELHRRASGTHPPNDWLISCGFATYPSHPRGIELVRARARLRRFLAFTGVNREFRRVRRQEHGNPPVSIDCASQSNVEDSFHPSPARPDNEKSPHGPSSCLKLLSRPRIRGVELANQSLSPLLKQKHPRENRVRPIVP